jgi:galactokinase
MDYTHIVRKFKEIYGSQPRIFRAPGRINLIGEHTDYNDGFVLPAAIDKEVIFAITENKLDRHRLFAYDLDQSFEVKKNALNYTQINWPNYLMGVIDQLMKRGHKIEGIDCLFGSDIPIGAGLSSSAAIESGLAVALNELFKLEVPRLELVKISQKAENEFVGVNCGIMDQFASVFGKKDAVFRLDCRSLDYTYYPLVLEGKRILLIDTQVKHELAASEYNTRRKECETGVMEIAKYRPEVKSLRDVHLGLLQEYKGILAPVVFKRCKYVVNENERVLKACDDLQDQKIESFGEKMFETHQGLRNDYEVSCPELDFLVDLAADQPFILGARMMGGGFGGCTINLVEMNAIQQLKKHFSDSYLGQFGIRPLFYEVTVKEGVTELK